MKQGPWLADHLVTNAQNSVRLQLKIYPFSHNFESRTSVQHTIYNLVSVGDEDEEGGGQQTPNCFDYFMHTLCIFWKILFACVPPTEYWNGWACFIVSISAIGVLTAIIGDLASHFGCTVGLRDSVTAVVFVALGTSLPVSIHPSIHPSILFRLSGVGSRG
uniref:Sodium/calcium exchanger membrane region domain-containing protein n=1 Tax=Kryptolebias marmoratus TaxID=37003 RepID=A0A3Q3A1D7_KRYMA